MDGERASLKAGGCCVVQIRGTGGLVCDVATAVVNSGMRGARGCFSEESRGY